MKDSALHLASSRGHLEIVRMLLDAGVDPTIQIEGAEGEEGMTALSYAVREGHDEIMVVLRETMDISE
ncbi:MAG: ankyrin repeat domain-containing protein [Candidatus Thorarchaeota archaeon SMTZ1-45]|nr:MAG: hypothetical protein AM325_02900 [Candidatus Thorarchaeota archaeon SMTZ1-45]